MKKTLIASAVVAATLSSTAFAMDPASELAERLDSMPTFYGNIQLAWTGVTEDDGSKETSTNELGDNGSTLGIKHDHMIADGVKGFLKAEFHFDADDVKTGSSLGETMDEAYIGVKGDFGSIQVGSDDTVYEWVDMVDIAEAVGISGELAADKEGDNAQYYSPEIAGGLTVGVTVPVDSDSTFGGQIAAKYAMDNIEVAAAYSMGREEAGVEAEDTLGLAASVAIEDLTLMAQYETQDDTVDYWALLANYSMGANNFAVGYETKSFDANNTEDQAGIYVQALHNVSDNMYVYLEYLAQTDVKGTKDNDVDTVALGATYAF